jgi:hypothetical protein
MKKDEAVQAIDDIGHTIHDLNSRMWTTALNPRENGWPASILSVAAIPITNAASIGHLVTSFVVKEIPDGVFDSVSNFGKPK